MNWIGKRCIGITAGLLGLAMGVVAAEETVTPEHAYRAIIDRNPFNLKPPPPPPPETPPQEQTKKGELKLTGITKFGRPKAFFMLTDPKGGPQAQPEYYSLGVDEKRDGLEVLSIDDVAKAVRVRYDGGEMLMTFATHGIAAPTATTAPAAGATKPPGAPGATPAMTGAPNTPNLTTAYNMTATPGTAPSSMPLGRIPSRPTRTSTTTSAGYSGIDPALADRYGLRPMPSNVPAPSRQPDADAAEQVILLELQRAQNPQLPPTPGLPGQMQPGAPTLPTPQLPGVPPPIR